MSEMSPYPCRSSQRVSIVTTVVLVAYLLQYFNIQMRKLENSEETIKSSVKELPPGSNVRDYLTAKVKYWSHYVFSARPPKPIQPNTANTNHFVDGGCQNFTVVSIMLRCTCQELELNTVTRQVETYESLREKWSAELSKLRTEHAQKQHLISDLEHSLEECSKQPQNQQVQTSVHFTT